MNPKDEFHKLTNSIYRKKTKKLDLFKKQSNAHVKI